jgi:hypothetical protein
MGDKIVVLPNLFFDINQTDTETLRRLFKIWLRDWSLIEHNPEEVEEQLYSSAKRSFSPSLAFFTWPSEF